MNKTTQEKADPSPYSNSNKTHKSNKSQKSYSDKGLNDPNQSSRSKSVIGGKVELSKNKTLDMSHGRIVSHNASHVFDYEPQSRSKGKNSFKSNGKSKASSKINEYKKNSKYGKLLIYLIFIVRSNASEHNASISNKRNKIILEKTNSDYNSENDELAAGIVKTPDDGELLDKKIIVNGSPKSKNSEYENSSYAERSIKSLNPHDVSNPNDFDDNYLTHISKKSESIRSLDMLNKRPSQRSKNKSFKSNKSLVRNMYNPSMSISKNSQKSEPVRHSESYKESNNRKLSLPEIQAKLPKKGTASFNHSKHSKASAGSRAHRHRSKNGNSYISFSSSNHRLNKNNTHEDINQLKKLDVSKKSVLQTDQDVNKMNETFESCTTEGKKGSLIPALPSTNKVAEEAYGGSQSIHTRKSHHLQSRSRHSNKNKSNSKRSQSLNSKMGSETIGEDSLPEIANSVVEDSLPFKGLDNHYKAISKEGFSGANDTNYLQKTNENFYSSFKSKQTENMNNGAMNIKENGFPNVHSRERYANQTEVYEDQSDLERFQNSNINPKSMASSPLHERSRGVRPDVVINENVTTQQPTFRSNNINISKRVKNKSKRSKLSKRQGLNAEIAKRKPHTQGLYTANDTNMAIIPNADNPNFNSTNEIHRRDTLDNGKLSFNV